MLDKALLTFLIALFYVLGAQLGFRLALLPDTSITLFWPPSGIALASVLLWNKKALAGVFLGAFVTAVMGLQALSFGAMLGVSLTISAATATAMFVAGQLLLRFTPTAPVWGNAADLFIGSAFMGLACLISAFFGAGSLYLCGMLPADEFANGFGTWWLGEYCGMMIFTPLTFAVARRNTGRFWRRIRPEVVLAPTILNSVITGIALATYLALWLLEGNQISIALEREASVAANSLSRALQVAEDDISSVRALVSASERMTNEEFQRYASVQFGNRSRYTETQGVGWAPRVVDPKAWEIEMLQNGNTHIKLFERSESGQKIPVEVREDYFPVQFIYPFDNVNSKAIGFDLGSEKRRRKGIEISRDTGQTSVVAPIVLVQSDKEELAMLICQPIYRQGKVFNTVEARRDNIIGVASAVYLIGSLFEEALVNSLKGIDLHLFDKSLPEGEQWLYTRGMPDRYFSQPGKATDAINNFRENYTGEATLSFGGRDWLIKATPGPAYLESQRTWIPWAALIVLIAFGMVISSILTERMAAHKRLEKERRKTETALMEARAANESKSYFMAAASHDIKQPLYALSILTDTLLMSDPPENTKSVIKSLSKSISEMTQHFDTLMDVGRFQDGSFEPSFSDVSLTELSSRINLEMAPICKDKKLEWVLEMDDVRVHTDAELLLRLMRNLLTNAVRYTGEGRVTCTAKTKGDSVHFEISDTGAGLSVGQQGVVFSEVVRLWSDEIHTSVHGLGLSIVNKISRALDLNLSVTSSKTEGTVFTFRIPRTLEQ